MQGGQDKSLIRRDSEIFLVSVLVLYLELVLIRWVGTEIRIFAYLGNLLLVVCFLGIGLGCYLADQPVSLLRLGVNLLLLAILVGNPIWNFKLVTLLLGGFEDSHVWQVWFEPTGLSVLTGLAMAGVLMFLLAYALVPVGQILGSALQQHPHLIRAYSVNIAGSLAGVWLLNALSLARTPPALWFAGAAVLLTLLVMARGRREWPGVVLVTVAAVTVWWGRDPEWRTIWSPYQKLAVQAHRVDSIEQGYELRVNDAGFQLMLNLSEPFLSQHPEAFDLEALRRSYYNLPFAFRPKIRRLLIVGAGTGNNAAAALRHGVEEIDCVEIDPVIYALGRELHPEHPYDSPRVRMVVNDARAFFKQSTNRYDAIWFAILDSHTLGSSLSNLRLDHYVYTRESLREARALLADDGLLIMNFDAPRRWVGDRLDGMLTELFGYRPLAFVEEHDSKYGVPGGVTLLTANKPVTLADVADPGLREFVQTHQIRLDAPVRTTTDDWPYLYLREARIPKLHWLVSGLVLAMTALAGWRSRGITRGFDWHFFALGAAFLLLEVQTVSRATLLFGMTWVVNAIVISAVLVMILLANLVAACRPKLPQWLIVAGLAATVGLLAVVPLDSFNALTGTMKLVGAAAFLTAPVFFAGLIFIRSFAATTNKSAALGANLLGALVGGLLESLAFVTGIRALVLLVGAFYVFALMVRPHRAQISPAAGGRERRS